MAECPDRTVTLIKCDTTGVITEASSGCRRDHHIIRYPRHSLIVPSKTDKHIRISVTSDVSEFSHQLFILYSDSVKVIGIDPIRQTIYVLHSDHIHDHPYALAVQMIDHRHEIYWCSIPRCRRKHSHSIISPA